MLYLSFSKLELWFAALPALLLLMHIREGLFWLLSGFFFFFFSLRCASISAVEFGGLSPLLFYPLFSALALLLGLYQFYAPLVLWKTFLGRLPLALPVAFVLFELLRSHFPYGGFPWLVMGALSVYLPVVKDSLLYLNVYWQSLFLLWSVQLLLYRKLEWLAGLWSVLIFLGLFALWEKGKRLEKAERVKVSLVQTAVPQEDKLHREAFRNHAPHILSLAEQAVGLGVDLVVLPESALHFFYSDEEDPHNVRLRELSLKTPILVGLVDLREGVRPYNSAYLLKGGVEVAHYDKVKLFPVGEYLPWPFGFLKRLIPAVGGVDYVRGERLEPLAYGKMSIATPICFEVAYH
ncbi:MAG: apolipoprotein N-acyltransferase, partial [Aquificaceae bacterium]|nr:apolipoprotein N-acyltransferase [Aquificaceae bacterium]